MGRNFADPHDRATRRVRIARALADAKGSVPAAASALGYRDAALYKAIRRFGLSEYLEEIRGGADAQSLIAGMPVPPRVTPERKPKDDPIDAPPHPRRARDHVDCERYEACLDEAARADANWVCADDCRRYVPQLVELRVPVRTNWQIESAGVSNRRNSDATVEDRVRHVRSLEARPLGAQVAMPWRLVG